MITLEGIKIKLGRSVDILDFEQKIELKKNYIYFVIGRTGIGKSSFLEVLTDPFNRMLNKSFNISLTGFMEKDFKIAVRNSNAPYKEKKAYLEDFLRVGVSYIPQRINSFHPDIPLVNQLYFFKQLVEDHKKDFTSFLRMQSGFRLKQKIGDLNHKLKELSLAAGFSRPIEADGSLISINDKPNFQIIGGRGFSCGNTASLGKYSDEFSSGQKQRLLIEAALLHFENTKNAAVLLGDEFLVNFSYKEANHVLDRIIDRFSAVQSENKTALFIFHDLSYPAIARLYESIKSGQTALTGARVLLMDCPGNDKKIKIYDFDIEDLFARTHCNNELFEKYKSAYFDKSAVITAGDQPAVLTTEKVLVRLEELNFKYRITDKSKSARGNKHDAVSPGKSSCDQYNYVFTNSMFHMNHGQFLFLTGFSGSGKSSLAKIITKQINFYDSLYFKPGSILPANNKIRYFPADTHESVSLDSNLTVREDIESFWRFYNNNNEISMEFLNSHFKKNMLDYDHVQSKPIYKLSGGELQRYWFARITFFGEHNQSVPELLIFDESIAALDCLTKNEIIARLLTIYFEHINTTGVIFISHDMRDLMKLYNSVKDRLDVNSFKRSFKHYEIHDQDFFEILCGFDEYEQFLLKGIPSKIPCRQQTGAGNVWISHPLSDET